MREYVTGVSRETFGRETGQTGGSGGQVRQARQMGQYSGGTGGSVVRSQVRQARQALRRSVAQVRHIEVGAPHSFWHVPMQKACHTVLISVK